MESKNIKTDCLTDSDSSSKKVERKPKDKLPKNGKKRPHGIILDSDMSGFSDLDSSTSNTLSSNSSSKLIPISGIRKSHSSVEGIKSTSTQEKALATLDNFIDDIDKSVEKAKEDEKQKMSSQLKNSASQENMFDSKSQHIRRSSSFPSIALEMQQSSESSNNGNQKPSSFEIKKDDSQNMKLNDYSQKQHPKENKSNFSSSGQALSDSNAKLPHLKELYKLVEHLESLQNRSQSNVESNGSTNDSIDGAKHNSEEAKQQINVKVKTHNNEINTDRNKIGPSIKSNNNQLLSHNKSITAQSVESKTTQSYACDDIDLGKSPFSNGWRQSSAKSPTKTSPGTTSPSLTRFNGTHDLSQAYTVSKSTPISKRNTPDIPNFGPLSDDTKSSIQSPTYINHFDYSNEVLPDNQNIVISTELGALQKIFPLPKVSTSEELLSQFMSYKHASSKKQSPHKRRRSWFMPKQDKRYLSNTYLPTADLGGFNVNLLAAQSLSDQHTLTLDMTTLQNTLSSHSDSSSICTSSDMTYNESLQVI